MVKNWFYTLNGQTSSAISEAALEELLRNKAITLDTYVWTEGMDNWLPLHEARPNTAEMKPTSATGLRIAGHTSSKNTIPPVASTEVQASFSANHVFARPPHDYAPPIHRFGVHLLDTLIFGLGILPAGIPPAIAVGFRDQANRPNGTYMLIGFSIAMLYVFWWFYFYHIRLLCRQGATWGMRYGKVKLVTQTGAPISFARALGRFILLIIICNTPLLLGQFACFIDSQKRTLHDMFSGTFMIKSP